MEQSYLINAFDSSGDLRVSCRMKAKSPYWAYLKASATVLDEEVYDEYEVSEIREIEQLKLF